MPEIQQFDRVYCLVSDKGKPISDPFLTLEEAEQFRDDLDLAEVLEQELLDLVVDWAGKKAEALGKTRREVLSLVADWRIGNYLAKGL